MTTKIMIVDDENENRRVLKDYLKYLPHEFLPLEISIGFHGKDACDDAPKKQPDLILMDWEMPVMTGIEALRILKDNPETVDIPIIMVTGAMMRSEDIDLAFEAGVTDYINKPVDKTVFLARVKSALRLRKAIKDKETLLYNILPREITEELIKFNQAEARYYVQASVLFTDFQGFTRVARTMEASELVAELDYYFEKFDEIIEKHNLEKIKTIGDAYMCVGGIPNPNRSNAIETVLAGLEIQNFMHERIEEKKSQGRDYWQCRIGINSGEVVAGVIGKKRLAYDVWGDTVNIASRLESNGEVDTVQISGNTYELVKDFFEVSHQGTIPAKNVEGGINAYHVHKILPEFSKNGEGLEPNAIFFEEIQRLKQEQLEEL